MNKISKTVVCALLIPAAPLFAVPGAPAPEVRGMAVTSVMTDRLSETAAGLYAAQEAGDSARSEALLSGLFAGGQVKASAAPVYAAAPAEAPAPRVAHYSVTVEELAEEIPGADAPAAAVAPAAGAAPEVKADAPAAAEDSEAAKKKEEDAKKLKEFKTGFYITVIALLLLLLLL